MVARLCALMLTLVVSPLPFAVCEFTCGHRIVDSSEVGDASSSCHEDAAEVAAGLTSPTPGQLTWTTPTADCTVGLGPQLSVRTHADDVGPVSARISHPMAQVPLATDRVTRVDLSPPLALHAPLPLRI